MQISYLPRSRNSPMIGNESAQTIFMKSFSQNYQRKFPKCFLGDEKQRVTILRLLLNRTQMPSIAHEIIYLDILV